MHLAYFSPLNPQPSGISDYSEELLPCLAAHAEIDLFVDGFRPSNPKTTTQFRWFDYQLDPLVLDRLHNYDAVIYHMGNDHRYHAGIYDTTRKHPGVVVFHDFALQDFFLGRARVRGDIELYLTEVAACHGKVERIRAEEHLQRGSLPPHVAAPLSFPLNCRVAHAAEGIIVHSEWSRARFEHLAPEVPVARIPMPVAEMHDKVGNPGPAFRDDNRQPRSVSIASFGLVTPDKGIELTLRALARLRHEYDFHFTLVGAENSYFDVRAIINDLGLSDRVQITGHVTLGEFERHISETDIAINLRQRTVGETSASLYRIMAAGVPAIVSNVGAFTELPDDAVVKVDHDHYTDALLQAYLRKLIEDTELRLRIGANARRHVLSEHDGQQSAARYVDFISEVIANRARKQLINKVSTEMSLLGIRPNDESLLRGIASDVALLAPAHVFGATPGALLQNNSVELPADALVAANGHPAAPSSRDSEGRLPGIEGIDYKRAAIEYPARLDPERNYYLRTKPFYNLKNKPVKHVGDGMDAETHRHFSDFANIAVALALPAGGSILDVGCGSGWLSEYFSRLGYKVLGVDISDDLIRMARERVERVPYNVDHETSVQCRFLKHDVESGPLPQRFDAIICYDALHHFEDEGAVFSHLAAMLDVGGLLFILEGQKPDAGSSTEDELREVMRNYGTLESPFSDDYLRTLLDEHGFAIIGDYVSVNGLFEREMLEENRLPLTTLATDYHYLTCKKVCEGVSASTVPDSRSPGLLRAHFSLHSTPPRRIAPGASMAIPLAVHNTGDTLWLAGQTVRAGVVMPAVRVFDDVGTLVSEFHGQPRLPSAVAPGETINFRIDYAAPRVPGSYSLKVDLVDQHVCWFEQHGSEPFVFEFEVVSIPKQ